MGANWDDFLKKHTRDKKFLCIDKVEKPKVISTGSWVLDNVTAIGGYPIGRLIELCGKEGCAKTTIAICGAVGALAKNMKVLFLDVEHALDPVYAYTLGLDVADPRVKVIQPVSLEETRDIAYAALDAATEDGEGIFMIIDSIPAMQPAKFSDEPGSSVKSVGLQARLQTDFLSTVVKKINLSGSVGLVLNQMRAKINSGGPVVWGAEKEESSGGYALKHYLSMRFLLKAGKKEKSGFEDKIEGAVKRDTGIQIIIRNKKNKVGTPWLMGTMFLKIGEGIDNTRVAVEAAIQKGIITKRGAGYLKCAEMPELDSIRYSGLVDFLDTNEGLLVKLLGLLGWMDANGKIDLTQEMVLRVPKDIDDDGDEYDEEEEYD